MITNWTLPVFLATGFIYANLYLPGRLIENTMQLLQAPFQLCAENDIHVPLIPLVALPRTYIHNIFFHMN